MWPGPQPGCGAGCTGRCSTGSAGKAAIDWPRTVVDAASVRAKKASLTIPNSVKRGNPGAQLHLLTDAAGLPLAVAVSAANTHDSLALIPLVQAIPAIRFRRGPHRRRPAKLHADKGYDDPHLRTWLHSRRITPRIARRGIQTSEKLGRHPWVIERSLAWLTGYRRLTLRYEPPTRLFTAFRIAATLTCYKRLTT